MEIKPNYNKEVKCHFCEKKTASEGLEEIQDLYRIVKAYTFPIGYEYLKVRVYIPRCKECVDKHDKFLFLLPIYFIISCFFIFFWFWSFDKPIGFWDWTFRILLTGFLSGLATSLLYFLTTLFLVDYFVPELNKIKIPESYEPISLLMDKGWRTRKPDPAGNYAFSKDEAESFSQYEFETIIKKITSEFQCIFKKTQH